MGFENDALKQLEQLLGKAKAAGADAADAIFVSRTALSLSRRLGDLEQLERSESADLGLRVFVGKRQAIVSSSDTSPDTLDRLVDQAVTMARVVPEDPFCGLADPALLATDNPDLDMTDDDEPSTEKLLDWAAQAEDAARAVPGVTNSEGAQASWSRNFVALAASNGVARDYNATYHSLAVSVLAGTGTAMERDYEYCSAVHAEDLKAPEEIGRLAGEKTVRRLNPKRVSSTQVPVVYDPRVSRTLIGHLAGAINGAAVARGTTFLKDRMGERIFPEGVSVIDDPRRRRGLRSKPSDAEGVRTERREVIEEGVLKTWFLDLRSARRLDLTTTGHASRGTSSPPSPSPTNLYLTPGAMNPTELMADIAEGLYVTELIGFGVNNVTGDYSRGAAGFWIENGRPTYPVSEITVAGNLNQMFANLTAADDLEFRYGTDAPTIRVEGMTVAGR